MFAATPAEEGQWGPVMDWGLIATHQVLMRNGKVLVWRLGRDARVWDPASGQLTPAPAPPSVSSFHCAGQVVLPDSRVLVIGGTLDRIHEGISTTATFDPATGQWTLTSPMNHPRWYPTGTVLPDGRVLAANGEDQNGADVPVFEVYDPARDTWSPLAGADRVQDLYSFNPVLPNGQVMEASPQPAAQLLDVGSGTWSAGPTGGWRTIPYTESDAMYRPGKIIRAGGTILPNQGGGGQPGTNRVQTIDMTSIAPAWRETTPMAFARRRLNLVLLADGQVLAEGGTGRDDDPGQAVLAGEIWNPDTEQWTTVASMSVPRMYHSAATLLPDGRVLTAGGEPSTAGDTTPPTAQVYSPPYLFKGPRPTIAAAPDAARYGSAFYLSTPDAGSIRSVALIRPSAVTHSINMDQRYVPLSFQQAPDGLTVTAPASGGVAPPGWYMLVIENGNGVPSVAAWIEIGAAVTPRINPQPPVRSAPVDAARRPTTAPSRRPSSRRTSTARRSSRALVSFRVGPRITQRTLRRSGLVLRLRLRDRVNVVRVRLHRVLPNNGRRLVTRADRFPRRAGDVRVRLRSRAVRRLRPGRYDVSVSVGTSTRTLRTPVVRRLKITRSPTGPAASGTRRR
ncbi:MAG TPA: galactose oxidase-like domain-containing protein [Solirubrobacteraceae bacterium]|nr:galactose oxidase-like domain-containing protein [Solirubrobacteraceae bacterium]